MLRMEIALILILAFVAVMYFSAERKKSQLHKVFSILLVVVLVHLVLDAATLYTVNHLAEVPALLNQVLHRLFVGSMALVVYLFYQYIAILIEEETGKRWKMDMAAKVFLILAEIGICVLPVRYVETPAGNYSAGGYEIVSYASVAVYLILCGLLLISNWKQIYPKKRLRLESHSWWNLPFVLCRGFIIHG